MDDEAAQGKGQDQAPPPPPPVAPPPLLKLSKGFVLVHLPPTKALLQELARLGIVFDHLIHFTSNPQDVEEAEAAGAAEYAFRDSEIVFEDEPEKAEVDPVEKELEQAMDEALILDIDVEPCKQPLRRSTNKEAGLLFRVADQSLFQC